MGNVNTIKVGEYYEIEVWQIVDYRTGECGAIKEVYLNLEIPGYVKETGDEYCYTIKVQLYGDRLLQ